MTSSLPNDVYSNLLQIPLFLGCGMLVPAVKRYLLADSRAKLVWRYDVLRHMVCNMVAFTFIIGIAMVFQGSDRLNFYTIAATDLSLGISLDILVHRAMRVGGCEIGNYGDPASYTRFLWHTAVSLCIMITTRSTSAIAAVFMFPFTNNRFDMQEQYFSDSITAYLVPALYFVTRTLMLDVYNRYSGGYVRVVHGKPASDSNFAIDDEDPPESTDGADPL